MSGLLERLNPGDHACLVAGDEPSLTRSVAAYVRAGLRARHRVLYLGRGERVQAELVAQGVEARINRLFAEGFAMGVCLYDRRLFSSGDLREIIRSHPCTITAQTDPEAVPLLRAVRITTVAGVGVRLDGEADLSNRNALRTVLEHLAEETGRTMIVDVTGLRFADSAAARTLLRVAVTGRLRLRLVGCSHALRRMLVLHGAGPDVEFLPAID
jgi:anti-anti-sigma factor